ncbi:hypothetical protein [Rhizobium sp. CNPSo 3490]|uniref:hypothetical protein n=1 Tax=Rhizobium sp. CNPSo 3490 TaxID=3021407 RepID=UPI0025518E1A|nr:hypothetical protein [Rhizobium sp. CNPSo 3490]MDK4735601.1 hypothetical protein [Rhizobium sp. CNPSo 3490]
MSGIAEQKEREDEERDYKAFLQQLIEGEDITGAAAGVTKKVITDGEESLVGGQIWTFDEHVKKPYLSPKCSQCGDHISWDQAYYALHGGGLCASCQHDKDKFFSKD